MRKVIGIASVLLVVAVALSAWEVKRIVDEVRELRRHPRQSVARELLARRGPGGILARRLMFKPGGEAYMADLRHWTYEVYGHTLHDDRWTRRLLVEDAGRMPLEQKVELLPHFPVRPTEGLLPELEEALLEGAYGVLPIIERVGGEESRRMLRGWFEEHVEGRIEVFFTAAPYLANSSVLSPGKVFPEFWEQLSLAEREALLAATAGRWATGELGGSAFDWLESGLRDGSLEPGRGVCLLLGRYLADPTWRNRASSLVEEELDRMRGSWVHELLAFSSRADALEIAHALFEPSRRSNAEVAAELLHAVAHRDVVSAEDLARDLLDGPDTELRKAAIVLLVRHDSALGEEHLDEAFQGRAPRRTMFAHTYQYIYGSRAADTYRRLARHDYKETGKEFPPLYLDGEPGPGDIDEWRTFVDTYPWFPGTDDAYYHLAFLQWRFGDPEAAVHTVLEALSRQLPDRDAIPFLLHLLEVAAQESTHEATPAYRALFHLRRLRDRPLGFLVYEDAPPMEDLREAVAWFRANEPFQRLFSPYSADLERMARAVDIVATEPAFGDRIRRLHALLRNDAASALCVLYGQCQINRGLYDYGYSDLPTNRWRYVQRAVDRIEQDHWWGGDDAWPEERIAWALLHGDTGFGWRIRQLLESAKLGDEDVPPHLRPTFWLLTEDEGVAG